MPANVLHDESKGEPWKVRVQPTVGSILDAARPATVSRGDQLVHGAIKVHLIEGIVAGRWRTVQATLGLLIGIEDTDVSLGHNGGPRTLLKASGR